MNNWVPITIISIFNFLHWKSRWVYFRRWIYLLSAPTVNIPTIFLRNFVGWDKKDFTRNFVVFLAKFRYSWSNFTNIYSQNVYLCAFRITLKNNFLSRLVGTFFTWNVFIVGKLSLFSCVFVFYAIFHYL